MNYFKSKLYRLFLRKRFFENSIKDWHLRDFSNFEKKILTLQYFCDITPENSDIIECGVGAGATTNLLCRLSKALNRRYFAFDTFSGFPDGIKEDNWFRSKNKEIYKCFSVDYIKEQLKNSSATDEEINSINFKKGLFKDTFSEYDGLPGFVFIDVDLYESYKICLEFFYPRLQNKGVILVDEYDSEKDLKKWPGAKIAIDEFSNKYKIKLRTHWTGQKYFLKEL